MVGAGSHSEAAAARCQFSGDCLASYLVKVSFIGDLKEMRHWLGVSGGRGLQAECVAETLMGEGQHGGEVNRAQAWNG